MWSSSSVLVLWVWLSHVSAIIYVSGGCSTYFLFIFSSPFFTIFLSFFPTIISPITLFPNLTHCCPLVSFSTFLWQPVFFFLLLLIFVLTFPLLLCSCQPFTLVVRGPAATGSSEAEGHADSGDSWHATSPSFHCRSTATCPWYY